MELVQIFNKINTWCLWKENLNSDGQQCHQYQQNKESLNSDGQQCHQYQQKRIITSHLKWLNTKQTMTYDVGYPGPSLEQAKTCGRVKLINWDPNPAIHFWWS
jgi:hypothetical protein